MFFSKENYLVKRSTGRINTNGLYSFLDGKGEMGSWPIYLFSATILQMYNRYLLGTYFISKNLPNDPDYVMEWKEQISCTL